MHEYHWVMFGDYSVQVYYFQCVCWGEVEGGGGDSFNGAIHILAVLFMFL